MPSTKIREKETLFWDVLNSAIALDFERGHLKWTLSQVARRSGITRSLIYYYFGTSKENLLLEGVKLLGDEVFGLSPQRQVLWKAGKLAESVALSRQALEKAPHLATFYLTYRLQQSPLGEAIRTLEIKHTKKLKSFFPGARPSQLEALFALFFGLAIAPKISSEGISQAVTSALSRSLKLAL